MLRRGIASLMPRSYRRRALATAVQGRTGQLQYRGLQGVSAIVEGSSVRLRKATMIASSS